MDKNIQEALKWIYASLGGDISDLAAVDDITVILNAIAELDTVQKINAAAGSDLPEVTSADNGDVLTVVNGAWDKAEASSDVLLLHINPETGALDKTWQEITDLLAAGKRLVFYYPYEGGNGYDGAGGTQVTVVSTCVISDEYAVWSFGYQISGSQPSWYDFRAFADTANSYPLLD